jgi:putative transposase
MTVRRITFRLYPNKSQATQLHLWRRMHKDLYNAAVSNRITQYKKFSHSVDYFEQQNSLPAFKEVWPEYNSLGSHALQATLSRVDIAFKRFFAKKGGFPKYKSIKHYSGWTYPDKAGWKVITDNGKNGSLQISKLGTIQMRGEARTWGDPSTCTILYKQGKWYASITVNCSPVRLTAPNSVGIDLGCKDAVTLSTGEKISKPEFLKSSARKVKQASKSLRRKRSPNRNKKVKGSVRWKKGRRKVSNIQRKVTRQREDWLHKLTSNIVSGNSLVAGEKLNVKGMTASAKKGKHKKQKAGLNRSILEVGFSTIGKMFEYKLAEARGFYVESPTLKLKPTQRCAECWELTPKTLNDRVHHCSHCGHTEDRDVNAAQVNLKWARGQELASINADDSSSTNCGSKKQLGQMKRKKLCNVAEKVLEPSSVYTAE